MLLFIFGNWTLSANFMGLYLKFNTQYSDNTLELRSYINLMRNNSLIMWI